MLRLAIILGFVAVAHCSSSVRITKEWDGGFQGEFTITAEQAIHGWKAHLKFGSAIDRLEIWTGLVVETLNGNTEYVIKNMPFDGDISTGSSLNVVFVVRQSGSSAPPTSIYLEGESPGTNTGSGGQATNSPATSAPSSGGGSSGTPSGSSGTHANIHTKYDYGNALGLSILFFDAQRSGRLPANNPIPWRGDSAVNDHGDGNVDLSGGWYDAGDLVKFNFPMASSAHLLAWGLNKFKNGYEAAGQLDMMYDMLKWPLDYFLKCWRPDQQELYVQVGNGDEDHKYWGRPEDMSMWRPAYKITTSRGGSDVAGETAAALAAGSIVWKTKDPSYSNKLLTAAKSLYTFAKNHKGIYSQSVPEAVKFYGSTGYNDELCEAAAQLYLATNDAGYLNDAKGFHEGGVPWALSWDDKKIACDLLLYEATKDNSYKGDIEGFVHAYQPGGSVPHTPCGLAWRDQWGSLRYAANAAFVATVAADDGIGGDAFKKFALSQINYILGDNRQHMSFEIGFGSNYPKQPHHRSSSCPNRPAGCNWDQYNANAPNPQVLKGALVGGPDQGDNYADSRSDYVKNEVTCDYNAGFQSALAGLMHFAADGNLPASPHSNC